MKILVADDSKAMRQIIMRTFRQAGLKEHSFIEASSGAEALDLIQTTMPDMMLIDINMPDINGLEVVRMLKSEQNALPFGFVTAETDATVLARCKQLGARFVLQKPFDASALRLALTGLLR